MNKKQMVTQMNNIAKGITKPAKTKIPRAVRPLSQPARTKAPLQQVRKIKNRTSVPLNLPNTVAPGKKKVVPGETKRGYTKYA